MSANQTGPWGALHFVGHARVIDPDGVTLAQTRGGRAGIAVAELDVPEAVAGMRAHIDHLADRRPQAYEAATASAPAPLEAPGELIPLHSG